MKKITVTKKQVLQILNETPATALISKAWIQNASGSVQIRDAFKRNCGVCAVGAVITGILSQTEEFSTVVDVCGDVVMAEPRQYSSDDMDDMSVSSYEDELSMLLRNKSYLNALLVKFEWEIAQSRKRAVRDEWGAKPLSRHQKLRVKNKLVEFVKSKFPGKMELKLDSYVKVDPKFLNKNKKNKKK